MEASRPCANPKFIALYVGLVSLLFLSTTYGHLQGRDKGKIDPFIVVSWKRGSSQILETAVTLELRCGNSKDVHTQRILEATGEPRYKLGVKVAEVDHEHCQAHGTVGWLVSLTENGVDLLGSSNAPYQDSVSSFDIPGFFLVGSEGSVGSRRELPGFYQPRKVQVEGFCVTMWATNALYNPDAPDYLIGMDLRILLENGPCQVDDRLESPGR